MSNLELERTALSQKAYRSLRTAILTGRIPFGTQLILKELADLIGFSPTPIKQALTSLEREGLVILIPYRGFFLPSFDARDVTEIYEIREALERRAARTAVRHITKADLTKLESILLAQLKSAREGNTETHVDLDLKFHTLIAEFSRNQRLLDQAHGILGQAQLLVASSALGIHRFERVYEEHSAILEAFYAHDLDAVELTVWQHLLNAKNALLNSYAAEANTQAALTKGGSGETFHVDSHDRLLLETELQGISREELLFTQETLSLDKTLSDKEKNLLRDALAEYIGPMAIFATGEILHNSSVFDDAIQLLASRIPNVQDAEAFIEFIYKTFP